MRLRKRKKDLKVIPCTYFGPESGVGGVFYADDPPHRLAMDPDDSGNTTALMRHLDDLLRDYRRRSEQDFIRQARALEVLEAAYFAPNRYRLMMVLGADLSATAARLDRSLLWTCRDCGQTSSEDDQRGGVHVCPVPLSLSWWQRFWLALTGRTL